MISLQQIETDLTTAIKARDQMAADVLRGLKTRIQNEKTAARRRPDPALNAGEASLGDLSETEIVALIRSEVKKRKEAATSYENGGRKELAEKENREAEILQKYLPQQMSEEELSALLDKTILENGFSAKDFGQAMGKIKSAVGDKADGATLAKLLKEKLK